jgi:hypothetical protein
MWPCRRGFTPRRVGDDAMLCVYELIVDKRRASVGKVKGMRVFHAECKCSLLSKLLVVVYGAVAASHRHLSRHGR